MSTQEKFQLIAAIPESGSGRDGQPGWKRMQLNFIAPNGRVGTLNSYDTDKSFEPGYYMVTTDWGNRNGKLEKVVTDLQPVNVAPARPVKEGAPA